MAGDPDKTAVFAEAQLLGRFSVVIALVAVPLLILGTFSGRSINHAIGERGYTVLFWAVMGGYTLRLLLGLFT